MSPLTGRDPADELAASGSVHEQLRKRLRCRCCRGRFLSGRRRRCRRGRCCCRRGSCCLRSFTRCSHGGDQCRGDRRRCRGRRPKRRSWERQHCAEEPQKGPHTGGTVGVVKKASEKTPTDARTHARTRACKHVHAYASIDAHMCAARLARIGACGELLRSRMVLPTCTMLEKRKNLGCMVRCPRHHVGLRPKSHSLLCQLLVDQSHKAEVHVVGPRRLELLAGSCSAA